MHENTMSSNYDYGNYSGGGGSGGGIGSSSTVEYDDYEISAADIAKDVVILFLSGVAILVGLVVFVYVVAMICDRFCRCCSWLTPLHTDGPRYIEGGEVARDAGLSGMTLRERRAVLEKVLVGKPYHKHTLTNLRTTGQSVDPSNDPSSNGEGCEKVEGEKVGTEIEEGEHDSELGSSQVDSSSDEAPPKTDNEKDASPNSENESQEVNGSLDASENIPQIENDSTLQCAICINEYEENDEVVFGAGCSHMFHRECVLEWLERHDGCPWCRKDMITSAQMREAAPEVLGNQRTLSLALGRSSFSFDAGVRVAPSSDPNSDLELGGVSNDVFAEPDHELGNVSDGFVNDGNALTTARTY